MGKNVHCLKPYIYGVETIFKYKYISLLHVGRSRPICVDLVTGVIGPALINLIFDRHIEFTV